MLGYDLCVTIAPQHEVAEHALNVLEVWLPGYTDPDDDGHQARVVIVNGSVEDGFLDVEVLREADRSLRFRVSVTVSPAPYPVTDEAPHRGVLPSRNEPGVVRPVPGAGDRPGSVG